MKYIKTYNFFENISIDIKSSIDDIKYCLLDIEDIGLNVYVESEFRTNPIKRKEKEEVIVAYIEKSNLINLRKSFSIKSIIDTINFTNSYCVEIGLELDEITCGYIDPKGDESVHLSQKTTPDMIKSLDELNINDIDFILMVYKLIKKV